MTTPTNTIPHSEALNVSDLVAYGDGAVVSRTLVKKDTGTVTLFAFDAGQGLSEHSAPFDALVQVVDGTAAVIIAGVECAVAQGEMILMPANIPHAIRADMRFKMLLTMLKT